MRMIQSPGRGTALAPHLTPTAPADITTAVAAGLRNITLKGA